MHTESEQVVPYRKNSEIRDMIPIYLTVYLSLMQQSVTQDMLAADHLAGERPIQSLFDQNSNVHVRKLVYLSSRPLMHLSSCT